MSKNKSVPQFTAIFLMSIFFSLFLLNWSYPVYSGTIEDLENEINKKTEELNKNKSTLSEIEKRIAEINGSSYTLTEKVNLLNAEITTLQTQIDEKAIEIEEKLKLIAEKEALLSLKKELFDQVSTELYMQSRHDSGQLIFSFSNLENLLQNLFVKKTAISILRQDIEKINGEFTSLSQMKADLEQQKVDLDTQKKDLDDSYALVLAEKNKLQKELNAQIATKKSVTKTINGLSTELSDLQYQLIVVRQGGTHVDINSVPASGDYNSTLAGFNANAPAGSFAVFSIGAYTHRNGMSQWGAKARAEAGQNYQQILNAYYPGTTLAAGTIENITVKFCDQWKSGKTCSECAVPIRTASYNFEYEYLYRLGEMPEYFPMEALKAQVISARTYALNATNYGANSIWGDECGQVVAGLKTGNWKTAVDSTRGVVMHKSGSVFSSQYAAVHGGWGNQIGWDTTDGTGSGDWMSRAWDRLSNVSWFYKAWYRQTYSESSSTCGRYPWLSQAEMSDIVNAYQVWVASNRTDSRISPIFDACHSTGNPYTFAELRALAAKPVTSISAVAVSSSNGTTTTVTFYTNAGTIIMSGNDFKTVFNLRAPGHLRIPQSGFVHINVHKK